MGCQQSRAVRAGEHLGEGWKDAVEEVLMPEARRHAEAYASDPARAGDEPLVVRIPMTVFVRFERAGDALDGDGGVSCVCTNTSDPDGSSICVCIGHCDFDACCDAPDAGGPIVAVQPAFE
jgi:hypothetical protein